MTRHALFPPQDSGLGGGKRCDEHLADTVL
jgi:hypothetical protein